MTHWNRNGNYQRMSPAGKIAMQEAAQKAGHAIQARHVAAEAQARAGQLPPGTLNTGPATVLTGKPGSS